MTLNYISVGWYIVENKNEYCKKCGRALSSDEIAITKKLINRGTTTYYCIHCLSEAFEVKQEDIQEKIQYYKEIGCTLFK